MMNSYTIGQLARLSDTGVETIRYYERTGLVDAPPRRASGYREYSQDAVVRLRFIRRAKSLGFSLKDIKQLLELRVVPGATCADVRERGVAKIADVRSKLKLLRQIEGSLVRLVEACDGKAPTSACPILDALTKD